MTPPGPPVVLFSEPDPSFLRMAAVLSPGYAASLGPAVVEELFWSDLADGDPGAGAALVRQLRERYVPAGLDPAVVLAAGRAELEAAIGDADVLVTERAEIDADLLARAGPRLGLIQKFGTRLTAIDHREAARRRIPVATWRRLANRRVAEHSFLLALALARNVLGADRAVRAYAGPAGADGPAVAYNWPRVPGLRSLVGRSLGIVGLGEIGAELARLAAPFGLSLLYTQRRRDPEREEALGVTYLPLPELLARADFVSLHLPLGEGTRRIIGAPELSLMPATACLVNTSRGALVDEDALVEALRSGRLAGAACDVFGEEPITGRHPLAGLDNVILTPHVAAGHIDRELMEDEVGPVANIVRVLGGRPPVGLVGEAAP